MKYNTISSGSHGSELKKSTLTIYTDPDFVDKTEDMTSIRGELEIVQRALKQQTKRCRQLVAEYTRRLQEKEQQYQSEKLLRDNQLAKVLRALLIFEARLKQEQKYISHQLKEKDYIINKQRDHIHKLSMNQHCKHCNQYFSNIPLGVESIDSSSEYVMTDIHDYQSSTFESLGSSNETYATISEKEFDTGKVGNSEDSISGEDIVKIIDPPKFQKNKQNNSLTRRNKKYVHKKNVCTYFEVLKLRNENTSPSSNDDNTSNDMDSINTESIPAEKIEAISERIENIFSKCTSVDLTESNLDKHDKDCNIITTDLDEPDTNTSLTNTSIENNNTCEERNIKDAEETKISDAIPVFDAEGESNDNWYASASDQEDDAHCDIYRNNPVLECMNQILLQNINDPNQSPQKSPTVERKAAKNTKKVKFSDEVVPTSQTGENNTEEVKFETQSNYYETPIQKHSNFYETPQSIYSNDYEQILSKNGDGIYKDTQVVKFKPSGNDVKRAPLKKLVLSTKKTELNSPTDENHYYIDMETKTVKDIEKSMVRKSKILRTPPALPPKPTNLVSKYKIATSPPKFIKQNLETASLDSEPDYCSISELNLPTNRTNTKKLNVVAEVNTKLKSEDCKVSEKHIILHSPKQKEVYAKFDTLTTKENNILESKNIEMMNAQLKKQSNIKSENVCTSPTKNKLHIEPEIPKLPQVSEIIIPDDDPPKKEDRINQDNYVKNNSQILKIKPLNPELARRSIIVGSSVSSIISGFNNQQLLSEMRQKPIEQRKKLNVAKLSSFECQQNCDKPSPKIEKQPETPDFDKFDLSQNFEEFKLDDCEIDEHFSISNVDDIFVVNDVNKEEHIIPADIVEKPSDRTSSRIEVVQAIDDVKVPKLNVDNVDQLRKKLELDMNSRNLKKDHNRTEPSYEHFLECTGLSSKSILTPSRMLSNHKSMLKPKDVKLRSKVKANNIHERQNGTIKYWSEPYV